MHLFSVTSARGAAEQEFQARGCALD